MLSATVDALVVIASHVTIRLISVVFTYSLELLIARFQVLNLSRHHSFIGSTDLDSELTTYCSQSAIINCPKVLSRLPASHLNQICESLLKLWYSDSPLIN